MMKGNLVPIGRVAKPHGVKGKFKLKYFGEDPSRVPSYREVIVEDKTGKLKAYDLLAAIPQPPHLILQLRGIERIEEVQPLIGKEVLVRKEVLPVLERGEYYWVDLLGMAVETDEGKRIGRVKGILPTPANDVYVVEGKRGEIFLPATEEVIQKVDLQHRVMKVTRMEGLWEDEDEV